MLRLLGPSPTHLLLPVGAYIFPARRRPPRVGGGPMLEAEGRAERRYYCGSGGGAGRMGPRPGSEGGGARHGGAASPGPSDAGSRGERIWAVRCGRGQRQKEDEARRAPRKGTRREGSGQTTPRPREKEREREKGPAARSRKEREARWRREGSLAARRRREGRAK
jgi:hypothetical protein